VQCSATGSNTASCDSTLRVTGSHFQVFALFRFVCLQPATQFMLQAFSIYARLSDADVIGQQMKYMQGMTYFYRFNIFIFMLLGFTILAAIYFAIWPSDR
jgi:hypothetical protein